MNPVKSSRPANGSRIPEKPVIQPLFYENKPLKSTVS